MTTRQIENQIITLIEPIVQEESCDLLDVEVVVEHKQRILRVYIDHNDGVTIDLCAQVSAAIEDVIEVEEILTGKYNLEVSSPGLNRPLRKIAHFEKALNQAVVVKTFEKINNRKHYKGILKDIQNQENLVIFIDNQDFLVPLKEVQKAHIVYQPKI